MLRPERMSKVSVTGAKPVMDDVIEAVHSLNLLHLSQYDGSWEGFERGNPSEGAEDASEKLVTIRSLKSILGVDADEVDAGHVIDDLESELEGVRERANDLDDRRSEIEDELRAVEDQIEGLAPFLDLGVDLDLLDGYETLVTAAGVGDADAVRAAVEGADGIADSQVIDGEGRSLVVFARPTGVTTPEDDVGTDPLEEALVGVDFERLPVPEHENPHPETQRRQLETRREQLQTRLADVESEIDALRAEVAPFLLAAEERLVVQVQKTEAPLAFATTDNSFVAEGWVPTDHVEEMEGALREAVGERVEFEELERAEYTDGHPERVEPVEEGEGEVDPGTGRESGRDPTPAPDGGRPAVTMRDPPPTTLDNPKATEPAEVLVRAIGLPKYSEFDPTWLVFLTFPVFFGFMIGDLGYGLLYMAVGYGMYTRLDSDAVRALGGLGIWAGFFTAVFGVLYGEFFGLHQLGEIVWEGPFGALVGIEHTPLHKGLQPKYQTFATAWLMLSLFVGLLHVGIGYVLGFLEEWYGHGLKTALLEEGSWLLLMFGAWAWIFSTHLRADKPEFLYQVFAGGEAAALPLGFTGLPEPVGILGLAAAGVGFVMLVLGEGLLAVEVLQSIVNVLSYARLMAVLLAKAGLAFVVNLLVFGAYTTESGEGEFHFISVRGETVQEVAAEESYELMFAGLLNAGDGVVAVVGLVAGIALLVIGHVFVLALGVTSAGLQGVRLEYVEFFGKFYDGGGRTYDPFGHVREHTTED